MATARVRRPARRGRAGARSRRRLLGAVLALAALLGGTLAGCGGGGRRPAGTVVIGTVGSYSGMLSPSFGGMRDTLEAWVASVNDAGGLRGHRVELVAIDDGGDASRAQRAVRRLVEQEHVVAIVGESSDVDTTWASYVAKAGIPVVGGSPANVPFATNADFFPSGASGVAALYGAELYAKQAGDRLGFIACAGTQLCGLSVPAATLLAQGTGVQVVYTGTVARTATDYTAECLALKENKVDSYLLATDSVTSLRLASSCRKQGVTARVVTTDGAVTRAWASEPAVDGALSAELDFPFVDDATPATKAYQEALARYAPHLGELAGPGASYGWVAGKLFEAAVAHAPAGELTPAAVKEGLYALHDETLGGLAPPLTFTRGRPTFVSCWFTLGVSGGRFTEPDGLRTRCVPPRDVQRILDVIG